VRAEVDHVGRRVEVGVGDGRTAQELVGGGTQGKAGDAGATVTALGSLLGIVPASRKLWPRWPARAVAARAGIWRGALGV
jgi:hypothetical protein